MHDGTFGYLGFFNALASNICFSSRAVLSKYFFKIQKDVVLIDEVCLFTYISNIGLMVLIPLTIFMEGNNILKRLYEYNSDGNIFIILDMLNVFSMRNIWGRTFLFIFNGIAYSIYNLMSFLVLSRTDLVTHAVLNCFRRVFIIIFTTYYFSLYLSLLNVFGISLAVVGVLLFSYSRSETKK